MAAAFEFSKAAVFLCRAAGSDFVQKFSRGRNFERWAKISSSSEIFRRGWKFGYGWKFEMILKTSIAKKILSI